MPTMSLADKAYDVIKEKLSTMENGAHLSLRNTSNEIGIGYTPVREALMRLEYEGYVSEVPKVGFFVQKMTASEIVYYYQARLCLESFAVREAFPFIDAETVFKLKEYLIAQERAIHNGDPDGFMEADIPFHEIFFEICGNPHLSDMYHSLREKYRVCSQNNWEHDRYPTSIAEHKKLLEAIEAHDRDGAVACIEEHIRNSVGRVKERVTNLL